MVEQGKNAKKKKKDKVKKEGDRKKKTKVNFRVRSCSTPKARDPAKDEPLSINKRYVNSKIVGNYFLIFPFCHYRERENGCQYGS